MLSTLMEVFEVEDCSEVDFGGVKVQPIAQLCCYPTVILLVGHNLLGLIADFI